MERAMKAAVKVTDVAGGKSLLHHFAPLQPYGGIMTSGPFVSLAP